MHLESNKKYQLSDYNFVVSLKKSLKHAAFPGNHDVEYCPGTRMRMLPPQDLPSDGWG